jgi:hypothetical protein
MKRSPLSTNGKCPSSHRGFISPEGSTVGIHATHNNSPSVNIQSPVMAQSADMTVTSVIIRYISQRIDKNVSVYSHHQSASLIS